MNRFLLTLTGFVIITNFTFAQLTLKIEITDLRNDTGKVMLQVFDENEKVLIEELSDIKEKSCHFIFKNLIAGKYAVRFYHDENLNQLMEINNFGKPKEGYGFSNNVTGKFGIPPFEKWLFVLNEDQTIVLKTVY